MIQSLQKEKIQNDKNYIKLINNCNNYKSKLNKLMDENKKLKQINLLIKKKTDSDINYLSLNFVL